MYVVTRTFRDANGVFKVGSIVDPTSVKTFKSRLHQKHIIDVNEANVDHWTAFFKNRYGIDLQEVLSGEPMPQQIIEEPQVPLTDTSSDTSDEKSDEGTSDSIENTSNDTDDKSDEDLGW